MITDLTTAPRKILNYGPRMERFAMRPPELDKKINLAIGSVRSGKTWGLHSKILYLCEYPVQGRRLLTGVSKATIKTNVLSDLFNIVGKNGYHYNTQSGELKLLGTDWIVYGAHDEGSEKYIRGATIGAAVCDEVVLMPQSYFQMLLTRLSPPGARLYGSTNSDNSEHWLKKEYLDNPKLKDILWWQTFTMDDNPNLDPQYVEDQKKLYTGMFYDRFILGLWNMAAGAVYAGSWTSATQYDDADVPGNLFGRNRHVQHVVGVDYGTSNPCVFLDGLDDGRTCWVDNEYYWDSEKEHRQKTDEEYADDLEGFIAHSRCLNGAKVLVDPSAASFKATLARRGFWLGDVNNDVMDGIRRTSSVLKRNLLRFHRRRCPNSAREFQGYAWDAKKAKLGVEEPVKKDDHCPDNARYIVNDVFKADWRLAV